MKVDSLSKIFERKKIEPITALKNISFDAYEGEFLSIVGPSGCGKTTLLRLVSGILPMTKGEVTLNGELIKKPQAGIGIVFQKAVLFKWRTILENVMLPVEVKGLNTEEFRKKAMDLLELVGLKGFEKRSPKELSGGMQQRASICRALINDPSILLMDEPFGALDALTRDKMNLWLQKIWSEEKKTVIFVTHYIPEAVFLSDRVIVLTPRPGQVCNIVKIDLPRPRGENVKNTPKFGNYVRKIRRCITDV